MELFATVLVVLALVAAYVFTVVPIVPGTLLVIAGALAWGFSNGFGEFGWWFWIGQAVLALIYFAIDNVAQAVGVTRAGGSREALWGGIIGVVAGALVLAPLLGPFALLVGPPIGAVAGTVGGEVVHRRRGGEKNLALHSLGVRAFVAWLLGTIAKLTIISLQAAWLVWAIAW